MSVDIASLSSQLKSLKKKGYSKIEGVLAQAQIRSLQEASIKFLQQESIPWDESDQPEYKKLYRKPVLAGPNWSVLCNVIGLSSEIDAILEWVFTHPHIKELLEATLGPGYKLWQANIRKSDVEDKGLGLHQDSPGETGISILITDTQPNSGTTAFIPGSHLYPVSIEETGFNYLPIRFLSKKAETAIGQAGDIFIFFNRAWHARQRNTSEKPSIALMISLFPVGAAFTPSAVPDSVLSQVGPELRRLLDPSRGIKPLADGRAQVVSENGYKPDRLVQHQLQEMGKISPLSGWRFVKLSGRIIQKARGLLRRTTANHMKK